MSTWSTHLPATAPFDFDASLRFLRGFPATAGEQDAGDGVLRDAVRAAGVVAALRIRAEDGGLRCDVEPVGSLTDAAREAVTDRVRRRFGLDDDLGPLYALAAGDPPFAAVVDRLHGYHQVRFASPLELLVWAELCQRTPMAVARRAKDAITTACGNEVECDGVVLRAFPELDQLLEFDEDALAGLIGNTRKARLLHGALRGWAELDEGFLYTGDHADVRAGLLALPGIGPWSTTFLMVRGLGRTEHIDPDPEGLTAASRVYGRPVDAAEFARLAEHYGRHQGYWAHYLRLG